MINPSDPAPDTRSPLVSANGDTGVPHYSIRGVGFLERVEVLKGPRGDLYGQNTTAGQINFISITPPDHFDSSLRLGYPSCQTLHIQGYVNGAPAHGIDGRIAFTSTQSGQGWQNSLTWPGDRCPRAAHDPCRARWVHSPATSPE